MHQPTPSSVSLRGRRPGPFVLAVALGVGALGIAACGSGDDESAATTTVVTTGTTMVDPTGSTGTTMTNDSDTTDTTTDPPATDSTGSTSGSGTPETTIPGTTIPETRPLDEALAYDVVTNYVNAVDLGNDAVAAGLAAADVELPTSERTEVHLRSAVADDTGYTIEAVLFTAADADGNGAADTYLAEFHVGPPVGDAESPVIDALDLQGSDGVPVDVADLVQTPEATLEGYYAAVAAGELQVAYTLWDQSGLGSGQSFSEFAEGYADTAEASIELGEATDASIGGAEVVAVPVLVTATTGDGDAQAYCGTYTLLRPTAEVGGIDPSSFGWRIDDGDLSAAPEGLTVDELRTSCL